MLPKILDSFSSLAPEFLEPVAAKEYPVVDKPEEAIDEHVKFQGVPDVSTDTVKEKDYAHRKEVP